MQPLNLTCSTMPVFTFHRQWVSNHYSFLLLDIRPPFRIFVGGHSAGGHLTACMLASEWGRYGLETQCPFASAVLVSGVFDLKPIQLCYVDEPLKLTE